MILVVQRVTHANVVVDQQTIAQIQAGLMVLVCAEATDNPDTKQFALADKLLKLRIFNDETGKMNAALIDQNNPALLLVPQFTLAANCSKGNRPSFTQAARPELGLLLFNQFKFYCEQQLQSPVAQGLFGANMAVTLCNDGPATFILNSVL